MSNKSTSLTFKSATTHQYIHNKSLYYELFNSTQDTNKEYIETEQYTRNTPLLERCKTVHERLLEMTKNSKEPSSPLASTIPE
ncbi:hypothetical protein ACO0RG_004597 [Hanseniaspora osmophila]|uniref:Uncharacterized protein n=1 Tax=Hanseniaspora osmophila TaxID=56408 RepID=A0A1E5RZU1_9ASCO|nr:hypothetical protein AWRI3579_g73 [Hanseniaspora osmophila]